MASNYTTKTAALRATKADMNSAKIKKLDASEINFKGQKIEELWGLNLPEDYPKFVRRCELPSDENWALWSDNGDLLYMNFSDKIKCGTNMFCDCHNLTTFTSDLSSLTNGEYMFSGCSKLTTFTSDLSSLINGEYMFNYCSQLESFNSDLSSLTDGYQMFDSCVHFNSFNSDLSSLTDGTHMFRYCYKLTAFDADLSSLEIGNGMFQSCRLNSKSIERILSTLPTYDYESGKHRILIGILTSAIDKFNEITGNTNEIPVVSEGMNDCGGVSDCGGTDYTTLYKGWELSVCAYEN